ncbi:hypothetical protein H257_09737 [Aphanomyces astaci]|uniref:Myosin motor domain-containing protein n=4 Tax=Aphanomyces astaci TaxID=112090 RepID=W4GB08_APHAT|nr:hypothetical protein H257_09737 [Aphanomyces astaci]ETV76244.1 hypothetical protein H257_09737 [Aphanomyces astaci]|eukprot:XP_009834369.1 hypothetical protein H257_09737 [Aphanomyces astaci]
MATSTATKARREGEKVWCPDPRNVWQLGSIVEDDGDSLFVLTPDDNEEHKFNVSQTHPFDPSHSMLLPNVSDMDNLHEAPLLDLLRRRYMEDLIYTFTGDILISINPYKNIPLLYNFPDIGSLSKQENPTPHVYVTADGAYRALQSTGKCQSILVSGESGAGKTEAAKYIMRYLANISQSSKSSHVNGGGSVEQCVLQSNPLLEAFGNAKTIRNDNSSRFGKFIKINYDRDGKICGASTSHFLLEKSRIVGCSENERNYHIFYQICSGLTDAERAALHLERADDYVYLNQGHCIQCPEVNDKKCFKELVDAMDVMGISADLKHNIFTLVASVLHLGNLNFVENAKNEATCPDKSQVAVLASLLEVTPRELEFALCMRTVSAGARGSVAEICLSGVDAGKSRNGLAKAIYSALFDWLVDRINVATAQMTGAVPMNDVGASRFIGILDIFGFEILAVNSFEQLCINYTNEMLQQQFNQHVFVYEQDVYVEEGIDWSKLSFQDNIPCLELIEKRPLGILILLDEQALMGRRASDDNFIQKLHQTHEKHANYIRPRFGNEDFIIKHYAGQVTYKVAGFLDKNNDSLHNDLLNLTNSSTMAFLRGLFASSTPPGDQKLKRASMTKMTGTMTVGRKFREQMTELMQQLNTTTPAFVRCVKPNNVRFPQGWNAELILNQLIYLGVMETVRIRRSGFPVRRTFNEFYLKYKLLYNVYAAKTKARPTTVGDKDKCELILTHAVERDNWQLGNKKVFMRDSQLRLLDAAIRKVRVEAAITAQAYVRRFLQRKQYLRVRAAIIQVQANVRMFVARTKFLRLRHRITSFNACVRRWLARRRYLRMKRAAICIQAGERGRKARMLAKYLRAAPKAQTVIAKHFRGYLARKYVAKLKQSGFIVKASVQAYVTRQRFLRLRHAAIAISKSAKRFLAVQRYRRQRQAAIIIHAVGRGFLARLKYGKNARLRAHIRSNAQTAISRMVRGYLGRLHFRAALRCIVKVQARWRANRVRTLYIQGRQATIASQAMIRRSLARRKFLREKKMATRLCAFGRMIIARRAYLKTKRQIVLVQSLVRRYLQRKHYRHIMRQFVLIQAMWRRHQCVQTYQRQRWAIVQIQSLGKMIPQRRRFHAARQAATAMTACVRMFLARRRYLRARAGFVRLQARWRSVVARRQYMSHIGLIVKVQSAIRAKLARKQMQTQRRGLLRVLALMRKYLARIRLHKKIDQMFAAAHAFDLSTILAMAQDKEFPNATMVRVRDKHNHMRSLVHIAALNGDLNLARFVLSEIPGMEDQVIGRDNLGNTPLHYAARLVHLDMVKYLAKIVNRINPSQDSAKHGTSRKSASPANSNNSPVNQGSDMLRKDSSFSQTAPRSPVGTPLWSPSMGGGANNTPGGKTKRRALVSSASAMPPNPAVLTTVELPPDTTKVLKAGPLRTASGAKMASKRHVVLDEYVLALYKSSTDRIPVKLIELQDVTLRRATTIENCFDILSPRLKCAKDPYGIVSFVADTEAEIHDWMKAIREVPMVRIGTLVPPNPSMICIDWSNRKEWINAKNNQHESALHLAVQNQEDEGFEAVKTAVWLIENDADINAKDHAGNTPLHYAVHEERDDLVESLLKKGALVTVTNNAGQTPLDMADEQSTKDLLAPGAVVSVPTDRFNLLARPKGPHKVKNATYVSVLLSAVAIAGAVMQTPHFRIYVMDVRGNVVDTPQHTPDALIQDGPSLWFGNTWHLQVPLEHMTEGCVAVFELLRYDYHTEKPDVFCWTFFRLDLSKISSAPLTFEMYAPPVNPSSQILAKMLGDSFFQADLSISL